jgi:hypothetical protein
MPIARTKSPTRRSVLISAALSLVSSAWVSANAIAAQTVLAGNATALPAATQVGGVAFDSTTQLGGQTLVLNGAGLRANRFITAYAAGLYLPRRAATTEQVLATNGAKQLQLRMLVDVPTAELAKAVHTGIARNLAEAAQAGLADRLASFDSQLASVAKVHRQDRVDLDFVDGSGMTISVNGRKLGAALAGADFYGAVLLVFLGEHPVDGKLKAALLGAAKN